MNIQFTNGATIMIGQFAGPGGYPTKLVKMLADSGVKNLTLIANTAGGDGLVVPFEDHDVLFLNKQVSKIICSFPAPVYKSTEAKKQIEAGIVKLDLVPLGNLAEMIRAGGAGIPAFYTPVGVGTVFDTHDLRQFNKKWYMLQHSLFADFALIRAHKADSCKNLAYIGSTRHFNPIMATAAKTVIAEVDEFVDSLDPEVIVTPGLFIDEVILHG